MAGDGVAEVDGEKGKGTTAAAQERAKWVALGGGQVGTKLELGEFFIGHNVQGHSRWGGQLL